MHHQYDADRAYHCSVGSIWPFFSSDGKHVSNLDSLTMSLAFRQIGSSCLLLAMKNEEGQKVKGSNIKSRCRTPAVLFNLDPTSLNQPITQRCLSAVLLYQLDTVVCLSFCSVAPLLPPLPPAFLLWRGRCWWL